ncbi:hypothetical protein LJC34_00265 [Oscillospiraceae bacterium OttesenSCG-928-G22]|nr:hypothetical protein [Oscillospiraceae bacterium OttesenSCG-928-G22]
MASQSDVAMTGNENRELWVYFSEDVLAQLQSNPETAEEIVLVVTCMLEDREITCSYTANSRGKFAYHAAFAEDDQFGKDLYITILETGLTDMNKFSGAWYDNIWWYIRWNLPEAKLDKEIWGNNEGILAYDELMDILEEEYPEISLMYRHHPNPVDYKDMDKPCPRLLLSYFLSMLIPQQELFPINESISIPDVDAELVDILYQAGIVSGVDDNGAFDGHGMLTRAQLATIIARVIEPELRIDAA